MIFFIHLCTVFSAGILISNSFIISSPKYSNQEIKQSCQVRDHFYLVDSDIVLQYGSIGGHDNEIRDISKISNLVIGPKRKAFTTDTISLAAFRTKWFKDDMNEMEEIWHCKCDLLEEYYHQFGTCNMPRRTQCYLPDGKIVNIGTWLNTQRSIKAGTRGKGKLPVKREQRLQKLVDEGKLNWVLNSVETRKQNEKWDRMYDAVLQYGKKHNGDCNIPRIYVRTFADGSSCKLGQWLYNQRQIKRGKNRTQKKLQEYREIKLQELVDQGKLDW